MKLLGLPPLPPGAPRSCWPARWRFLYFVFAGGGEWSLDAIIAKRRAAVPSY
jgi:hypothetical protein